MVRMCFVCLFAVLCHAQMLMEPRFLSPYCDQMVSITWHENGVAYIDKMGKRIVLKRFKDAEKPFFKEKLDKNIKIINNYYENDRIGRLCVEGDDFFILKSIENGVPEKIKIKYDLKKDPSGVPHFIHETEDPGRFLGYSVYGGFVSSGEASPCSWWRRIGNNVVELEAIVNLDYNGKPIFLPYQATEGALYAEKNRALAGVFHLMDYPIRIPGAFVVVSLRSGIFWIVRDAEPFAGRMIDVCKLSSDLIKGEKDFEPMVLGVQPTKSGKLLIACRTEVSFVKTQNDQGLNQENIDIKWLLVDPVVGDIVDASDEYINAPRRLSFEEARNFSFGFEPNGKLVVPWLVLKEKIIRDN